MPSALICSVLANLHRGEDQDPYTVDDFMLGSRGRKSDEEDMREFIDEIQSGKQFEPDPEAMAKLKASLVKPDQKHEIVRVATDAGSVS
jgi:hypothetical protein